MLLRASSEAIGEEADLKAAVGLGEGDVDNAALLAGFAEAATRGSNELPDRREALLAAVGPEAFVQAAATVGIFNGLVRVADCTGIPLDDGTRNASVDFRSELGLDDFAGARSTDPGSGGAAVEGSVEGLFGIGSART
jgi:hypothetical protein